VPLRGFILLVPVLLLFQGCNRKIISPTFEPGADKTIDIQEIDFEYFQGKARLNFKDDKGEREVKATIRVRKDSVIWMTFSVIGVQGGKALINKDSITVVSTVDKEYYVFDYAELSQRFNFNVNYEVLQAAFLGNLIQKRAPEDKVTLQSSYFLLEQEEGTVSIKSQVNAASDKIEKVELRESATDNSLTINYTNFQQVEEKIFPYNGFISLYYKTSAGILNNTITFEYNKAEVGDKELRFPFNIPRKYDRR
jgi:hypothetical protein